jgi:hypothetical protein
MTTKFIMESFWQHPDGYNCAMVAIIKVALLQFGTEEIFQKIETHKGNYEITLHDHKKISLSERKIKKLNKNNRIEFSIYRLPAKVKSLQILKTYVRLCYAVMLTYLNTYGWKGKCYSIKDAKKYLQYGYGDDAPFNTDHLWKFLGLRRATREVIDIEKEHLDEIEVKKALMLYSNCHVVAASEGSYYDYGTREKIKSKIPKLGGDKAKWWYEIIQPKNALFTL